MTGLGLLLLAGAAALLVAGAELFVGNAVAAGRRLGVSTVAVGLLLAGAEPEELVTAVLAALAGHPGLAAGDALGANVTMMTATLGLAALVVPLPVGSRVRAYAVMAAGAGVLAVLVLLDGRVSRVEGGLLVLAYVALVGAIWRREKSPPLLGELAEGDADKGAEVDRSPRAALLLVVVGIAVMTGGGWLAVEGAVRVVDGLDVADSAVGLTLLALATTAELFALVLSAARHGVAEIAVAGVVGSTAYNATATLGAAALARPLVDPGVTGAAALAAVLPLVIIVLAPRGRLGRPAGALLSAAYAAYLWVVLA